MRAIFCGTPEIAVPSLEALAEIAEIVGVVCQPDRPAGRGMKLRAPAVKQRALEMGLEVYQPEKVRDGSLAKWMKDKNADLALVIAYGRILNAETLASPRLGCVNLHASLLPKFRGAAPIQRVLMEGAMETGVCLMQMDEGMDTGDVLATHRLKIQAEDNAGTLAEKLGELAAQVTREEIPRFVEGQLTARPQAHEEASHAPPISKEDALIDFSRPAEALCAQIRGLSPRPGVSCFVAGDKTKRLKLLEAEIGDSPQALKPGEVGEHAGKLLIGTGQGVLRVITAQIEGKKPQSASELLHGRSLKPGDQLLRSLESP